MLNYGIDRVISFNNKPLRASVWLGFSAVLVAVIYVLWLVVEYLRHGVEAPGYLTTIATIVLLGGFQLIFLRVLGEYVGRIYYESKRRPPYIIAREFVTPESPAAPASPPPRLPPRARRARRARQARRFGGGRPGRRSRVVRIGAR